MKTATWKVQILPNQDVNFRDTPGVSQPLCLAPKHCLGIQYYTVPEFRMKSGKTNTRELICETWQV